MPALIHLVAKLGSEDAINACYRAELDEEFLIWTRPRIAEQIRAVNAGQIEALAHLRGQLNSIEDWNRALPEWAEGRGSVLIADHEATLTPVQLVQLRKYVLFIEKHRVKFRSVEGLDFAKMLLGGSGRAGIGVLAPDEPKSEIYVLCVRHRRLDLWAQFYRFRTHPSKSTWSGLKMQTVPWLNNRRVDVLVKFTEADAPRDDFPSLMALRRALLPTGRLRDAKEEATVMEFAPKKGR